MNKAAEYLRYSSDKQDADSIEAQRRACDEYAARNGLSIVGVYSDVDTPYGQKPNRHKIPLGSR